MKQTVWLLLQSKMKHERCPCCGTFFDAESKRFWLKVKTDGPIPVDRPELGACWVWTGAVDANGYGRFGVRNTGESRIEYSHRWSFSKARGPIPRKMVLDHLCRNPNCVNPSHLECVTYAVNISRGRIVNKCAKNPIGVRRKIPAYQLKGLWIISPA